MGGRTVIVALSLAALAASWNGTKANDSTAELATGGLVLTKTADIEMRSEDLFLSTEEIRVNYVFFNKSAKDKTVTVAFPMPDITIKGPDDEISLPTSDPENILGFSTKVGGKPVAARAEQKVFARGVDRTALLRKLGIPLAPQGEAAGKALDALPQPRWKELIGLGLADIEEYGDATSMQKHLAPRWTLKTTYFWDQTFPAGKELAVEHRYKPSVGGSVGTSLGEKGADKKAWYKDYMRKYCMDEAFLDTIERAKAAAKSDFPPLQEQRISYILKTGANWAGPIKAFRLVVDKGVPENLVSFCGQGVTKLMPTEFEMKKIDFVPKDDINVLILSKQPQ